MSQIASSFFARWQIHKVHGIKSFGPGKLRRQLGDVVGRANHERIGLAIIQPGQESSEHPG